MQSTDFRYGLKTIFSQELSVDTRKDYFSERDSRYITHRNRLVRVTGENSILLTVVAVTEMLRPEASNFQV